MYKYYSNIRERATEYFADIVCRNAAKYSVSTVVDSTQGKNDVAKFFDIPKDKIRIIPHIPPNYIVANRDMTFKTINEVLAKYELPEKYVFYPAQFWHHKNHLRLIQALKKISDTHSSIVYLVMTGHPYESYNNVMSLIRQLHMSNQIVHLGYVTDVEMVALYKKSVALVYPTLYGPTNIPPSEAMMLGVPVLCSNLFSMPEQLGDAGLLFDPFNIDDMAEKIFKIWTNENLRTQLIQKGYARVRNLTEENYARQWERVIDDAFEKLQKLS
jgi:glycosyltransferase involved in cell wall biosynthesis